MAYRSPDGVGCQAELPRIKVLRTSHRRSSPKFVLMTGASQETRPPTPTRVLH